MISSKYTQHVISFFMALFMSCIMSFFITTHNIGLTPDLLSKWLFAWAFGFAVALPTIFLVAPMVRKLAIKLVTAET